MITHKTPTGLPVLLEWDDGVKVEINDLYERIVSKDKTFEDIMRIIDDVLNVRERYGDVFTLLLDDDTKVSESVCSFILKYAHGIAGNGFKEMMPDTILLMLTPSDLDPEKEITMTEEDKDVLQVISRMDKLTFIRAVENTIGLVKLVEFYKLYLTPSKMDLERS